MNNSDIDKRQTIKYLNRALKEAIYHGGDGGGPYCTNEENLIESLNVLLEHLKLKDICKISKDRYDNIELLEISQKERLEESEELDQTNQGEIKIYGN